MAIDFDALDLIRSKNKANRHEALKKQKQQQRKKDIEYYMKELSTITRDHNICDDPAIKKLLLDKWLGVVKLCVKKIND